MKPKSERDCPLCQKDINRNSKTLPYFLIAWAQIKARSGRKKHISIAGYFCPNPDCAYFGVTDEGVYALVGDGMHGKTEPTQDFFCQACHTKFSVRGNIVLWKTKRENANPFTLNLMKALKIMLIGDEYAFAGQNIQPIRTPR